MLIYKNFNFDFLGGLRLLLNFFRQLAHKMMSFLAIYKTRYRALPVNKDVRLLLASLYTDKALRLVL